jgi:hypothetical protein
MTESRISTEIGLHDLDGSHILELACVYRLVVESFLEI